MAFQVQTAMATGPSPRAVAVGDFNGDGKADVAVAMYGNNTVYVYTGNGDGTLSFAGSKPVGTQPVAIVAVDLNQDGVLDIATANLGGNSVSVLVGNSVGGVANGTFQNAVNYATGTTPVSLAADNFDADGYVDLVTANQGNVCGGPPFSPCGTVTLLRNNGNGTFHLGATLLPQFVPDKVATGFFHGCCDTDLVVTSRSGSSVIVYAGDGGGGFSGNVASYTAGAYAAAPADFNGDGKVDLAISRYDLGDVSLLLGNGNGTLQTGTIYSEGSINANPIDAVTADFDADDYPDLALVNYTDNSVVVLRDRSVGNGGFYAGITLTGGVTNPAAVAVGDFNHDGKPDLIVADFGSNQLSVILNTSLPEILFANGFEL